MPHKLWHHQAVTNHVLFTDGVGEPRLYRLSREVAGSHVGTPTVFKVVLDDLRKCLWPVIGISEVLFVLNDAGCIHAVLEQVARCRPRVEALVEAASERVGTGGVIKDENVLALGRAIDAQAGLSQRHLPGVGQVCPVIVRITPRGSDSFYDIRSVIEVVAFEFDDGVDDGVFK